MVATRSNRPISTGLRDGAAPLSPFPLADELYSKDNEQKFRRQLFDMLSPFRQSALDLAGSIGLPGNDNALARYKSGALVSTTGIIEDDSGRVGIGTAAPASGSLLQIGDGTQTGVMLRLRAASGAGQGALLGFYNTGGTLLGVVGQHAAWIGSGTLEHTVLSAQGARSIALATNGVERVWITSGGRVGIGVDGPFEKLTNTENNILDATTHGTSGGDSVTWEIANSGYAFAVSNTQNNTAGSGLLVKIASSSDTRAFTITAGGVDVFRFRGTGDLYAPTGSAVFGSSTLGDQRLAAISASQAFYCGSTNYGWMFQEQSSVSAMLAVNQAVNVYRNALIDTNTLNFYIAGAADKMFLQTLGLSIGGQAARGTTAGTNNLQIFNGTAPVGTLTNGVGLYSASGELRSLNSSGVPALLSGSGIGYGTGAGGTVTQATSKSTGVTLNKICGQITTHNATLNTNNEVGFTVTNSTVAATDTVIVCIASGGTAAAYQISVGAVGSGSFRITLANLSASNLGEALVINFAVIKAVAA